MRHYRENFRHQMSRRLIEDSQFIGVETLAVQNVARRAKKKVDANGKYARNGQLAKRVMGRNVLRSGWSGFVDKIAYKAQWYGCAFVQVDGFYPSSRLCHDCGYKCAGLRLSERGWACGSCGASHDRGVNAALNILGEALRLSQAG